MKKWRGAGMKVALYLDDGLGGGHQDIAQKHSDMAKNDLIASGFLVNMDKSEWDVKSKQSWLGHVFDMERGMIRVSDDRIQRLLVDLGVMLAELGSSASNQIGVKAIARVAGQIISMFHGLGPISRLMTRNIYCCIETRTSWHSQVVVQPRALQELKFWEKEIMNLNGMPQAVSRKWAKVIFSDASDTGFGSLCLGEKPGVEMAVGHWESEEQSKSSTWREIKAVLETVKSMKVLLKGREVKWFTDNQSVVQIVNTGSMKIDLQEIALELFMLCSQENVILDICWIPRDRNQAAEAFEQNYRQG